MDQCSKKTLLLHACCAPCTPYVIELLQREFEVTAFFYNPNIHPLEEYQHRLEEIKNFSEKVDLKLITGDYEVEAWFHITQGMEHEKEGGKRCECCYRMRLERTVALAHKKGFNYFATTLTVSPHKKATTINLIGRELQKKYPVAFYEADFKKHDGFKKSCELSTHYGFYRQNYCGCVYSKP
jgi:predicted adenine nucleotide alpha hydrolase (AANH) superfamily ATPase